jgi:hypothetical protein
LAGEADGAAEAPDQGLDRQSGVGEVDVDALVLGELFPELGGQSLAGLGFHDGDGAGEAFADGAAPPILLVLTPVLPGRGPALRVLALLAQPALQRNGTADAEEEVAEMGLGSAGAIEIAGLEGGHALGLEARGQRLGDMGQAGQHREVGLIRGRRSGEESPEPDGAIDHF